MLEASDPRALKRLNRKKKNALRSRPEARLEAQARPVVYKTEEFLKAIESVTQECPYRFDRSM